MKNKKLKKAHLTLIENENINSIELPSEIQSKMSCWNLIYKQYIDDLSNTKTIEILEEKSIEIADLILEHIEEKKSSNKKQYRVEKTIYQDQRKVIDIQSDKPIFTITFSEKISFEQKEEIMLKIHSILNT